MLKKSNKRNKNSKNICLIFVSLTVLCIGTISIIINGGLTDVAVYGAVEKMLPAALILGGLGWIIGSMMDKPTKFKSISGYDNPLLDELLKDQNLEDFVDIEDDFDDEAMIQTEPEIGERPIETEVNIEPNTSL